MPESPASHSSLETPPLREAWESPPPNGWGSSLRGLGIAVFGVFTVLSLVLVDLRLVLEARHLGRHHTHGLDHALHVAFWLAALVLAGALLVHAWRRREGLSLLGAMLTDGVQVSRLRGRPPVFLDAPPEGALRFAQLSDLHIGEHPGVRLVERAQAAGNRDFQSLLDSPALADLDFILFTGDITDRGTAAAWRFFQSEIDARGLADRTVLVPGNHDLCLVEPFEPVGPLDLIRGRRQAAVRQALRTDRFGFIQLVNLLKFAEAFSKTGGGRRGFVLSPDASDNDGTDRAIPFAAAFAAVEREVRPILLSLSQSPAPPPRRHPFQRGAISAYELQIEALRQRLLALYPIAVPFPEKDTVVFVLNSCTPVSRHPATNALGGIGAAQADRLDRLARTRGERIKLVALHHHLVRRGEEMGSDLTSRLFARFSTLGDASRVIRFCERHGVRAVLNGHRHLSYQLRLPNGTVLLAAPSSTLGDELADDPRPQFECYSIAAESHGPSVGIHRSVIRPVIRAAVDATTGKLVTETALDRAAAG